MKIEYFLLILITIVIFSLFIFNNIAKENKILCKDCNVILIVIDALRADHLGCYGYKKNIAPNIDRLANKSILFTQAFSHSTWTLPSMSAIFTSLYPYWEGRKEALLPKSQNTLAEILKENNYLTAGFVGGCSVHSRYGFDKGFDIYNDKVCLNPENINSHAFDFLFENHDKKFFLYLHYLNVHTAYDNTTYELISRNASKKEIIDNYDRKILDMDTHIEELLDKLDELNLSQKTVIIVTADHGEELYDHGNFGHRKKLYDELIHVPLIMKFPFIKHRIITSQVRHIDIFPTILDVAGIKIPKNIEGESLLPIIKNNESENRIVYSMLESFVSIRTDNFKMIYNMETKEKELYFLKDKPKEKINLTNELLTVENNLEKKILEQINLMEKQFKLLYSNQTEQRYPYFSVPIVEIDENQLNIISSNPDLIFERKEWPSKYGSELHQLPSHFWYPWYGNGFYCKYSNMKGIFVIHPFNLTKPTFLAQNIILENDNYVLVVEIFNSPIRCKDLGEGLFDTLIKINILDHKNETEETIYEDIPNYKENWITKTIALDITKYANKNITFKIEGHVGKPYGVWSGTFVAVKKFYIGKTTKELVIKTLPDEIEEKLRELGYIT